MFDEVEVDWIPIVGPLIVLIVTLTAVMFLYALIFSRLLSQELFKFFAGLVALLGIYIWFVPMDVGFHHYFK